MNTQISEISPQDWGRILAQAPSYILDGSDGSLPPIMDHWLRSVCQPLVRQIEHKNEEMWKKCQQIDVSLTDPMTMAQHLASIIGPRETGAVLLVAGDDGLSSLIRAATNSRFSHVGALLPSPHPNEGPIVWQSYAQIPTKANYPYKPDFIPGQVTNWGADCSDLARYLIDYQKKEPHVRFVIRSLRTPPSSQEQTKLWQTIDQMLSQKVIYPNPVRLSLMFLRDRFPTIQPLCDYLLGPGPIDRGGEFCSMLITHTNVDAGLLELGSRGIESYLPGDYSLDSDHTERQPKDLRDHLDLYDSQEIELRLVPPNGIWSSVMDWFQSFWETQEVKVSCLMCQKTYHLPLSAYRPGLLSYCSPQCMINGMSDNRGSKKENPVQLFT